MLYAVRTLYVVRTLYGVHTLNVVRTLYAVRTLYIVRALYVGTVYAVRHIRHCTAYKMELYILDFVINTQIVLKHFIILELILFLNFFILIMHFIIFITRADESFTILPLEFAIKSIKALYTQICCIQKGCKFTCIFHI